MGKYRTINTDLNRQYRNDLNQNFTDIERDINSANLEIKRVETETIATIDGLVGGGFVEGLETARDNANTAATNANSKATYANTQGNHAKTQGDYAKAQGDYAKSKGEYADEKAILAGQAAANANLESSNLGGLKVAVVDATQAANVATTETRQATIDAIAATTDAIEATADTVAATESAIESADNANTKASLAQTRIDELDGLEAGITTAITNAEKATLATNDAITSAEFATINANHSATNADDKSVIAQTAADKADSSADNADTQAMYAKQQGDYAKTQGDAVQDIFDSGTVASVNSKTGAVILTASDVGAETEAGARAKAKDAEQAANEYTDEQIALIPDVDSSLLATKIELEAESTARIDHGDNLDNPHEVTSEQVNVIEPKLVTDLPNTYPRGINTFDLPSLLTSEWLATIPNSPTGSSNSVVESNISTRSYQIIHFHNPINGVVPSSYERKGTSAWGVWKKILAESDITPEPWIEANLVNGWTGSVKFRKRVNEVDILFDVSAGAVGLGIIVANIPNNYRPPAYFSHIPLIHYRTTSTSLPYSFSFQSSTGEIRATAGLVSGDRIVGQITYYVE